MSNYCSKHGKFCDNATEFGYCQTTVCINHNNSKIIDNKIITNREWLNSLSGKNLFMNCILRNDCHFPTRCCADCDVKKCKDRCKDKQDDCKWRYEEENNDEETT